MESDQDQQTWKPTWKQISSHGNKSAASIRKITMEDITETERDVGLLESDKTSNMETNQLSW
jgi:hypothetical protein